MDLFLTYFRLMTDTRTCTDTISLIFKILERHPLENQNEGRQIIRVLGNVLDETKMAVFDIIIINKFLTMYYNSVRTNNPLYKKYSHLNRGLENCIKIIIKNTLNHNVLMIINIVIEWAIKADDQEGSYDFGQILHCATLYYYPTVFGNSIDDKLFNNIIKLIESPNSVSALLGHKMFQNLIDRNKNTREFEAPRIFFK